MLWRTLINIANILNVERCWYFGGAFHFMLDDEHSIAVRPDSAGRVRFEGCRRGQIRATKWARSDDGDRIAALVRDARDEALTTGV